MSTATVFKPGGHFYDTVDRFIDRLPRGMQNAATKLFRLLVRREMEDTLATDKPTDAEIGAALGQDSPDGKPYSARFVQKGLNALDRKFEELTGTPLINRQSGRGCHGRRTITLTVGLAPSGSRRPAETAPPQPPPEEDKNTTTESGSSSSPEPAPEQMPAKAPDPTDPAIAALLDRALRLIPEATAGKVLDAVLVYSADWVRRALDIVERRPKRKEGNKPVRSWGYVLSILKEWQRLDGPPPEEPQPAPAQPAAPRVPKPAAAPPQLLSAEIIAEIVARFLTGDRVVSNLARIQLKSALRDGEIPAELVATIPAELLAAPEVAAPRSS